MAAFHQLLVRQETIFKQYSIKGYQLWVADAERAAVRSVRTVVRIIIIIVTWELKMFCGLVQYRAEGIIIGY